MMRHMISYLRCGTTFVCGSKSMLPEGKPRPSNISWLVILIVLLGFASCQRHSASTGSATDTRVSPPSSTEWPIPQNASPQLRPFLASAIEQTGVTTGYDPAYVRIDYPGGDVPPETGVCSDVLIRAFRKAGIDLQKEVHEDMSAAWSAYPQRWGASGPDSNIDHRPVSYT